MKSWKIGGIAGLIAGIVAGIVAYIFTIISPMIVLFLGLQPESLGNIDLYIMINSIWGVILGIIYARFYRLIPGKNILKGLMFGLIIFLITNIRDGTFWWSYGTRPFTIAWIFVGFFQIIAYGLMLSFLYESLHEEYSIPKEKLKIKEYGLRGGFLPGAIAGLLGGILASIFQIIMNVWIWKLGTIGLQIDFLIGQVGTHLFLNMFWGAVFGAIFGKFYNLVPGKLVMKGLYFSMIILLITSIRTAAYFSGWDLFQYAISWAVVGFFNAIVFGLVLGYLYKPKK
jgi:hypothetical protein